MRVVHPEKGSIYLGHVEDNESLCVVFDAASFYEALGDSGEFSIRNQRPCDPSAYPISAENIHIDGNCIVWLVTSADLYSGVGQVQIKYNIDDVVMMDNVYRTICKSSIGGDAEPPDVWQSYVDAVTKATQIAEQAAADARSASEAAADAVLRQIRIEGHSLVIGRGDVD